MTVTAILPVPAEFLQRREAVFTSVAGRSTLARIVEALQTRGDVVVAAADPLARDVGEDLRAHGFAEVPVVIADAPGGRAHCLVAGLRAVAPTETVLVHDLAWPLIAPGVLGRVVAALQDGAEVALPVCPVTDSIKVVDDAGRVTATVDRSPLRTVQFPRGFTAAAMSRVLAAAAEPEPGGDADDLAAAVSAELPVTVVDGDTDVASIDLPADADYLAAVIARSGDLFGRGEAARRPQRPAHRSP
ncbi:2-C-methyl-D-erythritol 4-phosphate cytidylyltransferase [Mycolicibacterium iranicum]|uniref:2-C-methyl-D-erythritol 4-phosphate cytidylyltransferase n=1 Tax=Mycolicibacterium iranicum TaxID=912594 RepID=A0A839Q836_MYCIR|nr:2-C-methyl-D-erythritol 4-phosphate cytidylyltransferase [Mycolicibacterium iranicum]MBB2991797.1 2-C-methyl-D-erythritol 4-phosphate cytidylyltransferase [Mycolicibacterium iranicum]